MRKLNNIKPIVAEGSGYFGKFGECDGFGNKTIYAQLVCF